DIYALPLNATYPLISYSLVDFEVTGAELNGFVITALRVGFVTLRCQADDYYQDFSIEVLKEPVTAINFSASDFKVTEAISLNPQILPINATYPTVIYSIIGDNSTQADITDDLLTAKVPGIVTIRIKADDIQLDLVFVVKKEPVVSLNFGNSLEFKVTQNIDLEMDISPLNATYQDVSYQIVGENEIGAELNGSNLSCLRPGTVKIKANADGISCEETFTIIKEAVQSFEVISPSSFKTSEILQLQTSFYPLNATYPLPRYTLLDAGATNGTYENNQLRATLPGTIQMKAEVDDLTTYFSITVEKEAVTSIVFTSLNYFKVTQSLILTSEVYPENATYKDVEYSIITSNALESAIDN
ncbi:MAG: hypothetical protein EZS28_049776, partial [Streblomastix strix]